MLCDKCIYVCVCVCVLLCKHAHVFVKLCQGYLERRYHQHHLIVKQRHLLASMRAQLAGLSQYFYLKNILKVLILNVLQIFMTKRELTCIWRIEKCKIYVQ